MPSDLDIARQLLTPKWRDVEFYCGPWSFSFDQQHAIHAYPDRDAAFIEATGRNPARYSFTAYFRNGISGSVLLYPDKWRLFVAACLDRSTGKLIHPELGAINVKVVSYRSSFDPMKRDGMDVDVEFIESVTRADELADLVNMKSPMEKAVYAARDLDTEAFAINPTPTYPSALTPSALDSLKKLSGALQQFKMGIGNVIGQIDSITIAVDQLRQTIESVSNPSNYKALEAIDRLIVALFELKETLAQKGRPITPAIVRFDSPLPAVAKFFNMSVDDLLRLNAGLARKMTVAANTPISVFL